MNILLLGREINRNTFTTLEKLFELEKAYSEVLFFDNCSEDELISKLKKADIFIFFPGDFKKKNCSSEEICGACFFELIASGYLLAYNGRKVIFTRRTETLDDIFSGESVVSCIGEALAYFRREKRVFENNRMFLEARRKITESHLSFSTTGMVQAVEYGMYLETEAFLKAGFSSENENPEGVPLLSLAVRNGDMEITRLLMSYGASLNVIARDRRTSPLMDAVTLNNSELASLLINAGADLNYRNRNGQSALIVAIGSRMKDIAEILINSGADLALKDSLGMAAPQYAKLFSMTELYSLLGIEESQ